MNYYFTSDDLDINTSELPATVIRTLSDFRDIYLSKLPFGDKMVYVFYWLGGVKSVEIGLLGNISIQLALRNFYYPRY